MLRDFITGGDHKDLKRTAEDKEEWRVWSRTTSEENQSSTCIASRKTTRE